MSEQQPPVEPPGQNPGQNPFPAPPRPHPSWYAGQPAPPDQPFPGYPTYAWVPPELPAANTAMVLGIVGLVGGFFCLVPLLCAPFAWVMGAKARRTIRESQGRLGGDGKATAGMVTGIVGTVILALGIIGVVVLLAVAVGNGGVLQPVGTNA